MAVTTNDGKRGGNLVGKPHNDKSGKPVGGIKAVVTDAGGKPVELEGGEVIINKEASKKHWKELSRINQSAGNGVPINKPIDPHDEDPEEYKEGGRVIEFNRNHVPNKWILSYAKKIKADHPEIWKLGGNIFGNQAFENLKRVAERGYWLDSEEWMYIKWRSYVARHKGDFRIEGVVAMLKWVDKVEKGFPYMKNLIQEKIEKLKSKKGGWKHKMKHGANINKSDKNENENPDKNEHENKSIIQEAISHIRGGIRAAEKEQSRGFSKVEIADCEAKIAYDFAIKKGIFISDFKKLPKPIGGGGNENTLYYNQEEGIIFKLNNLFNSDFSISKYLEYILVHNKLFPNTKYTFHGFAGFSNGYPKIEKAIPLVQPLMSQKYIKGEMANQSEIDAYMNRNGFEKINEHTFSKENYVVSDLKPRNVLKDSENKIFVIDNVIKVDGKMLKGGNTIAQTPAPKKERIFGSKVNKPESASSEKSGKSIRFTDEVNQSIKSIIEGTGISLATAKAVVRRGMGAYSSSHRPTIRGGKPNSRTAWGLARLKAFVYKAEHGSSKSGKYTQDDDLLKELGFSPKKYVDGGDVKQKIAFIDKLGDYYWITTKEGNDFFHRVDGSRKLFAVKDMAKRSDYKLVSKKEYYRINNIYSYGGIMGGFEDRLFGELAQHDAPSFEHGGDPFKYLNRKDIEYVGNSEIEFEKKHLGGDMTKHLAPNGRPSNLTHEQWHLVRTPEFKAWFGDWEKLAMAKLKDPAMDEVTLNNLSKYVSKVVDENDEPLVVYHGTNSDFNTFRYGEFGFHFGTIKQAEKIVSPFRMLNMNYRILSCFINLRNPVTIKDLFRWETPEIASELLKYKVFTKDEFNYFKVRQRGVIIENLLAKKIDGIKYLNEYEKDGYSYSVFEANNIKLATGENTTFDGDNPDIRFDDGGNIDRKEMTPTIAKLIEAIKQNSNYQMGTISVAKDGQKYRYDRWVLKYPSASNWLVNLFEKAAAENGSKYRKQFNYGDYYSFHYDRPEFKGIPNGKIRMSELILMNGYGGELAKGIKAEMEHKDTIEKFKKAGISDKEVAKQIALDHLKEDAKYYTKLYEMEHKKMANGGEVTIGSIKTPTGEPTRLNYLQQLLVRTKAFKDFFGDWEYAAKSFIADNKENFEVHFKNVSKVIDYITLEPRVVFHGTSADQEFYNFDVARQSRQGRPYAYFAHNSEYADNFTQFSQRQHSTTIPIKYSCFANIRNTFYAVGNKFEQIRENADYWFEEISNRMILDKLGSTPNPDRAEALKDVVKTQIYAYLRQIIGDNKEPFWVCMARDVESKFKAFLLSHKYDGIEYYEEFSSNFDASNPREYTRAITVFNATDIKLADGRNLTFNPFSSDIRMKEGGNIESEMTNVEIAKTYTPKQLLDLQVLGKVSDENDIKIDIINSPMQSDKNFVDDLFKKMNNGL